MLQRLAQFRVALLDLFEQPHILDGDDGLVGEGFEQRDLLVGEGPHLRAAYMNRSDRTSLHATVAWQVWCEYHGV